MTEKKNRDWKWQDRYNYRNSLTIQWLRLHRPDIAQAIEDEVDAKFPASHGGNRHFDLPEKLRNMK